MLQTARRKKIIIGPEDHGRRMSLDDFDRAIARPGYLYELGKGAIEVRFFNDDDLERILQLLGVPAE